MGQIPMTISDYHSYVVISNKKRLLVEGSSDRMLFSRILDIFDKNRDKVDLDDASMLSSPKKQMGNREKIELVCKLIAKSGQKDKLIGFVDREFRKFILNKNLSDQFTKHFVGQNIVWSRGHSIENYLFEFETMKDPFASLSTTSFYRKAQDCFEENFECIVQIACAASLSAKEIKNFGILKGHISWDLFKFEENLISLDYDLLRKKLINNNCDLEIVNKLISRMKYWEKISRNTDSEITRWLCHGHLGFKILCECYKSCISFICGSTDKKITNLEVSHSLETNKNIRLLCCGNKWIERAMAKETAFPFEVIDFLGFN